MFLERDVSAFSISIEMSCRSILGDLFVDCVKFLHLM